MKIQEYKNVKDINLFFNDIISTQSGFEQKLNKIFKKQNGIFLTNTHSTIENIINVIKIDSEIFNKRILEPSCGQGIFILKIISDIYLKFPYDNLISHFISNNLYFVDIQETMISNTISNIKSLYKFFFNKEYTGRFNGIVCDFTLKNSPNTLFYKPSEIPLSSLYNSIDYIVGNPPYITLYGRRDKKENEAQRIKYLTSYDQFPDYVKNGKINLIMLFIEHSLDLLKDNGRLSFILDISFFETAYQYTRKYLLENTTINELHTNIKNFNVASGQLILKVTKLKSKNESNVKIFDYKTNKNYFISQNSWLNKDDEFKFRFNGDRISRQIINKINSKSDQTILQLHPNKNLRTCAMLLDMEDKFTYEVYPNTNNMFFYPYYQGSKALSEKYGFLNYKKYFYYNKSLQNEINNKLKIRLEKEGIKNKKRIGFGETIIYDNPKIYIRQSSKEIIATVDLNRSSANNSLYVFSLRNNSREALDYLFFLCGLLNSDLVTYYAQQMNIIRYSAGKQPQIKISDLGSIYVPSDQKIKDKISNLCKLIYRDNEKKELAIKEINNIINKYYELTEYEINNISKSIKDF